MRSDIILIGPFNTGKTTVGKLLSKKLGVPNYKMDDLRYAYYKEIGYEKRVKLCIADEKGFLGVTHYWKPFEAHAVERLLEEKSNCIIDFGAGHSVFEDSDLFDRVSTALGPYPNVVLILPSKDLKESVNILRERSLKKDDWDGKSRGFDFHEHYVMHSSNHELAKIIVYTQGKSPEDTRDEILDLIEQKPERAFTKGLKDLSEENVHNMENASKSIFKSVIEAHVSSDYSQFIESFSEVLKADAPINEIEKVMKGELSQWGKVCSVEYLGSLFKKEAIQFLWKVHYEEKEEDILWQLCLSYIDGETRVVDVKFN